MMSDLLLKGVRIADLSHYWSGPRAARIMADFGAEVIRVEYIRRLCVLRGGQKEDKIYNKHPMWHQVNRNKLSITLDLNVDSDREAFLELVKISDVVLDNSRSGVMEKLGFGYDDLVKIKPDLIIVSMPAFGKTGPYSTYAGVGGSIDALSGIQGLTSYDSNGKKMRIKEMDTIAGINGACAIMTALIHRQKTGEGQRVDLSQLEANTYSLIGEHLLEYVMNGTHRLPLGNRHWKFAPQGCYRCKGEDNWVVLTVCSEEEWRSFCQTLGYPEWIEDSRFCTKEARVEYHDELDRLIEAWTIFHSHYDVMHILQQAGIPAGAVLNAAHLSQDPHLKKRKYFISAIESGNDLFPGLPFRLSRTPGKLSWRGPDLGQHNQYVLCGLLRRPKNEIKSISVDQIGTGYDPE